MRTSSPLTGFDSRAHRRRQRARFRRAFAGIAALALVGAAIGYFVAAKPLSSHEVGPQAPDTLVRPAATVERTVAPDPAMSRPATLTIAAVGDMIFDRKVGALVASQGGSAPLRHVADILSAADVAVGNLESPLSDVGTRDTAKDVTFRGDPRGVEGLSAAGFDLLALANNHALDYGAEALLDTIERLDAAGIAHAGAGADRAAAWEPAVVDIDGTTVAYLSFSHILPAGFIAGDGRPGIAAGRTDMLAVSDAVRAAKDEYDYVLVSFHWGVEYVDDANADQVRDARTAVDAGADMVLSHHPHVIQGIELYNGGLIAYSLGDFVFDHYSRKTGEAFILEAELGANGISDIRATPVYLDGSGTPAVVTGNEAAVILGRLKTISAKHGTDVMIDGDIALVVP